MTEEDIKRIIAEENVRTLIKKEESKKSLAIWKLINSPFGIWFSSSIFLGSITFGYSRVQSHFQQKIEKEQLINMIDLEIESRLFQFKAKAERSSDSLLFIQSTEFDVSNIQEFDVKDYFIQMKRPTDETDIGYYSVYTEFEDRTLISLLFELSSLVPSRKDKLEINSVVKKIMSNEVLPIDNIETKEETLEEILNQIRIKRWSKIWTD